MQITLYSQPNCHPCVITERILTKHGLPFTKVDLTQDASTHQAITSLGYRQTPVIEVVFDDEVVTWPADKTPDIYDRGESVMWSGLRTEFLKALVTAVKGGG